MANSEEYIIPDYEFIKKTRDYIIFDKAPKLVFNYNAEEFPFDDWYTNVNRETDPKPEVPGTLTLENCPDTYKFNNIDLQYIRVRGNYTANYRKKSLKIKFNEKQNILGLNNGKKAKEWLLLADHGDNSMLRNALGYYMGQKMLSTQWSSTFTFVQVYLNDYYLGLFLLCDQKEVGKNRVNVNEPEKNYTGVDIGYFFERDDYYDPIAGTDPGFIIHYSDEYIPAVLPKISHPTNQYYGVGSRGRAYRDGYTIHSKIYSDDQAAFLKKYMQLAYNIIYEACIYGTYLEINSNDINDWQNWELVPSESTDPAKVVGKVIDLDSFINMYILQEFVGDPDLAHSSFYFCLDASPEGNRKVALTCPWDHDRTLGLCDGLKDAAYNDLWVKDAHYNPWVAVLPQADWFKDLLKQRWQELYDSHLFSKCLNMLEDYARTYEADFALNYQKYNIRWEDEPTGMSNPKVAASIRPEFYEGVETQRDTETLLSNWINTRFQALHEVLEGQGSTNWPQPPIPPEPTTDPTIFRKDKLVKAFTQEEWNEKYNNAASQADELTKLWNQLYAHPSNAAVIMYNKMYAAVAAGKKLTDPELQADLKAWNANAAR